MTRREFDEEIVDFGQLINFCYDEDCDYCDDIMDEDHLDAYLTAEISNRIREESWTDIRDWLYEIPTNTSYYRNDNYSGIVDAEYDFDDYKDDVLSWCLEHDVFEEEYEAEDEAENAPEMPVRHKPSHEDYLEEEDSVEIEEPDAQVLYTLFSESAKRLQVIKASQPVESTQAEPEDDALWFA